MAILGKGGGGCSSFLTGIVTQTHCAAEDGKHLCSVAFSFLLVCVKQKGD